MFSLFSEAIFWLTSYSCSTGGFFPWATDMSRSLPQRGLSTVCSFLQSMSPLLAWGPPCAVGWISAPACSFMGCRGTNLLPMVFSTGKSLWCLEKFLLHWRVSTGLFSLRFFSVHISLRCCTAFLTLSSKHYSRRRTSLTDRSYFFCPEAGPFWSQLEQVQFNIGAAASSTTKTLPHKKI